MMKTFRYALVVLCLALMSSYARSQTLTTAYDLTTATAGSSYLGNQGYGGTQGMEFDVNSAAIKVTSLGVFDSGMDGFHTVITAYLFEVGNSSPIESISFSGTSVATAGQLEGYNRFIDIPGGLVLQPGAYIIAGGGFNNLDPEGNETVSGFVPDTFGDGGGLITAVGPGLFAEAQAGAGAYPNNQLGGSNDLAFNEATFQYTLYVPEPGSVASLLGFIGTVGTLAFRKPKLWSKK